MARVVYTKEDIFKLFGLKIFSRITKYAERSRSSDNDLDEEIIDLQNRVLENRR